MANFDMLKKMLSGINSNMQGSNDSLGQQVALAKKRVANPEYQGSPEELQNEDAYNKNLVGAVAGSLAPGQNLGKLMQAAEEVAPVAKEVSPKFASLAEKLQSAKAAANDTYENALRQSQAKAGYVAGKGAEEVAPAIDNLQESVAKKVFEQNRAQDFADRLARQKAARRGF